MNKSRLLSMFMPFMAHFLQGRGKYTTKRPQRSAEFIEESKALAEAKRQRRCERNLRIAERGGYR